MPYIVSSSIGDGPAGFRVQVGSSADPAKLHLVIIIYPLFYYRGTFSTTIPVPGFKTVNTTLFTGQAEDGRTSLEIVGRTCNIDVTGQFDSVANMPAPSSV